MSRPSPLLTAAVLIALGSAPGCDAEPNGAEPRGAEPRDAEEGALAAAPEADGLVAQDAFCDAYLDLTCQANVRCCGLDEEAYASVEACKAATPCPLDLAPAGALDRYDPAGAGAFLRAQARAASTCEGPVSPAAFSMVLGAADAQEGAPSGPSDEEAEAAVDDAFCDDGVAHEDVEGPTDEATNEPSGGLEPRSAPSKLCVKAANNGTTGTITLDYQKGGSNTVYTCVFTGGLDSGEERCCTTYSTSTSSISYTYPHMWVENSSSDGFKLDRVKVGSEQTHTFKDVSDIKCNDCFLNNFCDSCWVDTSGNGGCGRIRIDTDYGANADIDCDER